MVKKVIQYSALLILVYCLAGLSLPYSQKRLSNICYKQANYLGGALAQGLDYKLQNQYPEGYIFSHSLLALSLIELHQKDSKRFKQHHQRSLKNSITKLIAEEAKQTFSEDLTLPYGAFYNGWTNLVLKKFLSSTLSYEFTNRQKYLDKHHQLSQRIKQALKTDTLLESYHESYWPADNLACITSLTEEEAEEFYDVWLNHLKLGEASLIPHDLQQKEIRGSSQALSLYFLSEIQQDSSLFAMNALFKTQFEKRVLGIHFIRENQDQSNKMDVDSGPVIWGIGSVATLMNVRAQSCMSVNSGPTFTYGFLNLLGVPITGFKSKYYLFKQAPMFDLFMLWVGVSLLDKV